MINSGETTTLKHGEIDPHELNCHGVFPFRENIAKTSGEGVACIGLYGILLLLINHCLDRTIRPKDAFRMTKGHWASLNMWNRRESGQMHCAPLCDSRHHKCIAVLKKG